MRSRVRTCGRGRGLVGVDWLLGFFGCLVAFFPLFFVCLLLGLVGLVDWLLICFFVFCSLFCVDWLLWLLWFVWLVACFFCMFHFFSLVACTCAYEHAHTHTTTCT